MKFWYVPLFLVRELLLLALFQTELALVFEKMIFVFVGVQVFYILFIIFGRPYESVLHSIGVLVCEFSSLYALVLSIISQFC